MTAAATEPTFVHAPGCHAPRPRVVRGKYGGVFERCQQCRRSVRRFDAVPDDERTPTRAFQDPEPVDVDLPRLVAICERRGVPVMRVDEHGELHLIRTTEQLLTGWED